ncbi:hypothetical protein [Micromonospora sp. NBC_01412]|uniref:hypothetical protein n=1 Tax=Micromonospora sp. NBC_01412 TaxID=2903590 RepID=UPI00325049AC
MVSRFLTHPAGWFLLQVPSLAGSGDVLMRPGAGGIHADVAFGMALNVEDLSGVVLGTVFGTAISMIGVALALAASSRPPG